MLFESSVDQMDVKSLDMFGVLLLILVEVRAKCCHVCVREENKLKHQTNYACTTLLLEEESIDRVD